MFPSSIMSALVALCLFALSVSAHGVRVDWVSGLDDCWEKCLQNTEDGCNSSSCICDASQDGSYLPPAVSCMASKCDADEFAIGIALLLPLAPYCGIAGKPVPQSILSSAYAAATATSEPSPSTTRTTHHNPKPTSKEKENTLTKVITTTLTTTSTDQDGNTLQVVVPILIGPSGLSSGKPVTSTINASKTINVDPASSTPASPSPTPDVSSPTSTQDQQPQVESTAEAKPTNKGSGGSNSNGSPFENMQAGASQWGLSRLAAGLGLLAGIFLRM
ncbi:hypothetical protein BU24DRAFT_405804 [Aaosphaeria arxii CBS 175.79]|uniref:Extracellular membrane protein CFEM domain-containing protein n=1 Tax=Aaosphaeria arxii CBS 175.79 TaxID=1450172 RepID=A0A6A5Y2H7_9PLEO|nr:uncharacterized protein BU24DRAFT_405804 [Aaosphaeria arxii CBS 175.79]KAF2019091.1 hypothetical protein BU24DRAFT_405804 [Aaosphaeria arxii CBS 175.79]